MPGASRTTFQSRMVVSSLAEARVLPSGEKATALTKSRCPGRLAASLREATDQSLVTERRKADRRGFAGHQMSFLTPGEKGGSGEEREEEGEGALHDERAILLVFSDLFCEVVLNPDLLDQ